MSLLSIFSGKKLYFQYYFLVMLLKHAGPNLEMSFLRVKAYVQAQHNSAPYQFSSFPFFGKLKHRNFYKGTTLIDSLYLLIHKK